MQETKCNSCGKVVNGKVWLTDMKITYDKKADAANIVFQKGKYHLKVY